MRKTIGTTAKRLSDLLAAPDGPTVALAGAGAGNVDDGAHIYAVSFVTARGETIPGGQVSVTVADKTVDGQVALSNIPLGPTGTTARKIWRTEAAGSQLKLQSTISNNTATTATDNVADAGLGANAPTEDNSELNLAAVCIYDDLTVENDAGSPGDLYVDVSNPNISTANYGSKLAAGGYYHWGAHDPIDAGMIWLVGSAAGVRININARRAF